MRPQEAPRQPGESFYFDKSSSYSELVIDQALVAGVPCPNVEIYDDRSVVVTVQRQRGGDVAARDATWDKGRMLYPGERVVSIMTGSDTVTWDLAPENGMRHCTPGGERTGEYVVQEGDDLIVKCTQANDEEQRTKIMIVSAREFLPGEKGDAYYEPLGIMRTSGELVMWGQRPAAHQTSEIVDLTIASYFARSETDLRRIAQELRSFNLLHLFEQSESAAAYLGLFLRKFGVDFKPFHDPRQRYGEFS